MERLLVKGPTPKGVELELNFRLVDVDELPAHPMATFIIPSEEARKGDVSELGVSDKQEQGIKHFVKLGQLQRLAASVPMEEAASAPPSKLIFHDSKGLVSPDTPMVVVVAGLVQREVMPEAGPGYTEAGQEESARLKSIAEQGPAGANIEVIDAKLSGGGGLLNIQFKTKGIRMLDSSGKNTYVLDPATNERYSVLRVPRLGLMAPRMLNDLKASFMVIHNRGNTIKAGQRISVVVAGVRQDDVLVKE